MCRSENSIVYKYYLVRLVAVVVVHSFKGNEIEFCEGKSIQECDCGAVFHTCTHDEWCIKNLKTKCVENVFKKYRIFLSGT